MKRFFSAIMAIIIILLISSCNNSVSEGITTHQNKTVTFNGSTILDNEMCFFRADKIDPNAKEGYTLSISFKNKTNNKNLMFSLSRVSVNGFMCDPYWGRMTTPGEELSDNIIWNKELFEKNSINEPTDIELTLRVYDYNDLGKKDYYTEQFVIFPNGQNKVKAYKRNINEDDLIVFDNDNAAMIIKGYSYDEKSGFTVNALIENKSDKNVIFTIEKASINESTVIPFWSCETAAGKCANEKINWTFKQLEDEEIDDEISDVEFSMRIFDISNSKDILNQTFILSPNIKIQKN